MQYGQSLLRSIALNVAIGYFHNLKTERIHFSDAPLSHSPFVLNDFREPGSCPTGRLITKVTEVSAPDTATRRLPGAAARGIRISVHNHAKDVDLLNAVDLGSQSGRLCFFSLRFDGTREHDHALGARDLQIVLIEVRISS